MKDIKNDIKDVIDKWRVEIRNEAIREFGHLLIDKAENNVIYAMDIPDYVKEMTGE